MYMIFIFLTFYTLVNGNCDFQTNTSKVLRDKLKANGVYNQTYTISNKGSTYYIGICTLANSSIDNGAVVQQENNILHILGQLNQSSIAGGDDWILLTYENEISSNNDTCGGKTRSTGLMFVCGKNTNTISLAQEPANEDHQCNYIFEFQGYGMCPIPPKEKKRLSGGAIFLLILLCLVSAYLIGGFFYMRIKRGARGLDQIPNLDMWRRLGALAADGCDYCCRCNRNPTRTGYLFNESVGDIHDDDILAP